REARRALGPVELTVLGDWLRRNGHDEAALIVYLRRLHDHPDGPGAAQAHLGAGLIELARQRQPALAYQHLSAALQANPSSEVAAQARTALAEIARMQKRQVGYQRGTW